MIRKVKKRMIARREKKTSASPISWVGRRNWNFINGVSQARNRQPVDDESGSFVSLLEISSSPRNKYYSDYKKSLKSKHISIWKVKKVNILFGRAFQIKQVVSSSLSSNFKKI
ncbi:PREDICTED: uncharacterized protein LOC108748566 [Trachymyrmex septentrionalis]|uniref:uncharacterized protein LOC108748566 n=1 Tax=Trachymyrmex septentrionalis TaxID=34720 RepID=UPI00084F31E8|nr:PREDICTED: uncharacterized protein LOC108748566 [Trachymyrmex septentrionalis]